MTHPLNPIIHSPLRLSILSILMTLEETDFMYLKQKTEATMGNLSVQITKLEECGYITVEKTFQSKRPRTVCRMTEEGKAAFIEYVNALNEYISPAVGKCNRAEDSFGHELPDGHDLALC